MQFALVDLPEKHLWYVRRELALHAACERFLGRLLATLDLERGRLWAIVPVERKDLATSDLESDPMRSDDERSALMAETVRQLKPRPNQDPPRLLTIEYWTGVEWLEPGPGHAFPVGDSAFDYVTPSDPDEVIAKLLQVSLWYPTVGVIGPAPIDVPLPGTRELDVRYVEAIADRLDLLLIGAWGADGYVFWEPGR